MDTLAPAEHKAPEIAEAAREPNPQVSARAYAEAAHYLQDPAVEGLLRWAYAETPPKVDGQQQEARTIIEVSQSVDALRRVDLELLAKFAYEVDPRDPIKNGRFIERDELNRTVNTMSKSLQDAFIRVGEAWGLRTEKPLPETARGKKFDWILHGGVGATPRTRLAEARKYIASGQVEADVFVMAGSDRKLSGGNNDELEKVRKFVKDSKDKGGHAADLQLEGDPTTMTEFELVNEAAHAWLIEEGLFDVLQKGEFIELTDKGGQTDGEKCKYIKYDVRSAKAQGRAVHMPNEILVLLPPVDKGRVQRKLKERKPDMPEEALAKFVKDRSDTEDAVLFAAKLLRASNNNVISVSHNPVLEGQHFSTVWGMLPEGKEVTSIGHHSAALSGSANMMVSEVCKTLQNAIRVVETTQPAVTKRGWLKRLGQRFLKSVS